MVIAGTDMQMGGGVGANAGPGRPAERVSKMGKKSWNGKREDNRDRRREE